MTNCLSSYEDPCGVSAKRTRLSATPGHARTPPGCDNYVRLDEKSSYEDFVTSKYKARAREKHEVQDPAAGRTEACDAQASSREGRCKEGAEASSAGGTSGAHV